MTEKLWKQFSDSEADKTHLNCDIIQIFGKGSDDKYIKKGEITYKKLYEDNLSERAKNIVINTIPENEKVYLYKREFNGLDKKCDEKLNLMIISIVLSISKGLMGPYKLLRECLLLLVVLFY